MRKIFLSLLLATLTMSLNAQDEAIRYFFAPVGQGDEDGTSWENAAGADLLGSTLADAEPGTEFYLMEGAYAPDINTNKWVIPQGVLIKGGYPTTMTGTETSYNYMRGGQSVFSADLDGDGKGDNTKYTFVYIGDGTAKDLSDAYYSSWQKTEIWGITFRDAVRPNVQYWGNMVFVQAAQVDFHFCRFLNNDSQTTDDENGSNGALQIWGSAVRCFDCIFRDNYSGKGKGAAFQVRPRQSNSSTTDPNDGSIAYFERCEFRNNLGYSTATSTEGNQKWGQYGGCCSVSDNGGTVYFVNCLMADNQCWNRGSGIRVGTNAKAYFICNTFYNNPCRSRTNRGSNNGSAVSAGDKSKTWFAGNIMVEHADKDDFTATDAVVFIQTANSVVASAGYNIFGTVANNSTQAGGFLLNDDIPTSVATLNTIESVFGSNTIANHGGVSDVIAPLNGVAEINMASIKSTIATWPIDNIAKVMDLDKDQRGYIRAANTIAGSYDPNGTEPEWTDPDPHNPDEAIDMVSGDAKCTKVIRDGQVLILRAGKTYNAIGQEL